MKESIDDATWTAKYMGNPYIREGLLFPADELRYYNGVLPDGEPDRIAAVVDTAWGGRDSLSMPIAYVYGDEIYIHDVVFNAGDKTVTRPLVIGTLKKHRPHMVRWESNNGGDEYGGIVDERLRDAGGFPPGRNKDGNGSETPVLRKVKEGRQIYSVVLPSKENG